MGGNDHVCACCWCPYVNAIVPSIFVIGLFNSHTQSGPLRNLTSTGFPKFNLELLQTDAAMSDFPEIKSTHSLVAKHVTPELWAKLSGHKTATSGFTLAQAIACAVQFDDQHCGIYAGDEDSYKDFAEVFDPLIQEYHGISADAKHTSDMDVEKINGNIDDDVLVKSVRIRVGRSIEGFGLSPGITKEQRLEQEKLMINAFAKLEADLSGTYDISNKHRL